MEGAAEGDPPAQEVVAISALTGQCLAHIFRWGTLLTAGTPTTVLCCKRTAQSASRARAGACSPLPAAAPALPAACSQLEGTDLAAASQVNRQWRDFLLQEEGAAPWARACAADYLVTAPESPDGAALPSFRAAYAAWHSALARYGEAGRRARAAWAALEAWTQAHFPEIRASLR